MARGFPRSRFPAVASGKQQGSVAPRALRLGERWPRAASRHDGNEQVTNVDLMAAPSGRPFAFQPSPRLAAMEAATSKARAALISAPPMKFGDQGGDRARSRGRPLQQALIDECELSYQRRVLCDGNKRQSMTVTGSLGCCRCDDRTSHRWLSCCRWWSTVRCCDRTNRRTSCCPWCR